MPAELRARLAGQAQVRRERFTLESVTAASTLGVTAPITTTGQGLLVLPDQVQVRLGGPAYASVGESEIVALGDQLYLRVGQQWLAFDNDPGVASLLPVVGSNFTPERGLAGVGDVREVDRDSVRGAATTVYGFTLAPAQLQQSNLPGAQGIAATWEQGEGRVWIGDDGVIRRLETRLTGRTAQGAPATARTTLDFFDFNDPTIAVSLPPGATPVAVARPSPAASPFPGGVPLPAAPASTPTAGH